jgi:hypothetical protein
VVSTELPQLIMVDSWSHNVAIEPIAGTAIYRGETADFNPLKLLFPELLSSLELLRLDV